MQTLSVGRVVVEKVKMDRPVWILAAWKRISDRVPLPMSKERLATFLAIVVPLYGLLRLFAGLLHWVLPERILATIPDLVSDVHNAHAITSGAILFFLGLGLLKRQRLQYHITLLVLGLAGTSGLVIGVTPWFWGSAIVLFIALLALKCAFPRRAERILAPGQVVGLAAVLLALAYGVVGSYLLRDQFMNLTTWGDALYFAITTLTTLGYGDIIPKAGSPMAKLFSVTVVIVGISTFITAISLIVVPFLESQMKGVMKAMDRFRKRPLQNHVIVCYYTRVGESVVNELRSNGKEFLVIEPEELIAESLQAEDGSVLQGDPTQEETLVKANIGKAEAIVTCSDADADNALITLIAREFKVSGGNPRLRIIARVEQEHGVSKLRTAGADHVVSPSTLGGHIMGKLALGQSEEKVRHEIQGPLASEVQA